MRSENGESRGETHAGFAKLNAKMDKGFTEIRAENKASQSHQLRGIVGTIIAFGSLIINCDWRPYCRYCILYINARDLHSLTVPFPVHYFRSQFYTKDFKAYLSEFVRAIQRIQII